jgi:hypothetical protein
MKRSSRPPRRLTILVALAGGVITFAHGMRTIFPMNSTVPVRRSRNTNR